MYSDQLQGRCDIGLVQRMILGRIAAVFTRKQEHEVVTCDRQSSGINRRCSHKISTFPDQLPDRSGIRGRKETYLVLDQRWKGI